MMRDGKREKGTRENEILQEVVNRRLCSNSQSLYVRVFGQARHRRCRWKPRWRHYCYVG